MKVVPAVPELPETVPVMRGAKPLMAKTGPMPIEALVNYVTPVAAITSVTFNSMESVRRGRPQNKPEEYPVVMMTVMFAMMYSV